MERAKRPHSRSHSASPMSSPAVFCTPETHCGRKRSRQPSPLPLPLSSATTAAVADHFSAVEIEFQLDADKRRHAGLYPRDIGNLLLWSVPTAVPLIEGPRVFLLRNKSKLRDVVMVYVDGWTYTDVMSAATNTDSTDEDTRSPKKHKSTHPGETGEDTEREAAMLWQVRTQQCWAREAVGVQCAPLLLSGGRCTLGQGIFWRGDAPRTPGERHARVDKSHLTQTAASPTTAGSVGVGGLFGRALHIHHGVADPAEQTGVDKTISLVELTGDATTSCNELNAEDTILWGDRETLLRYALSLPADAATLEGLSYLITPPSNDSGDKDEDSVDTAWTEFAPPSRSVKTQEATEGPRVFALDCEMVLVENRVSALARATLVDVRNDKVVLDMLVKPHSPVVDYLTRYSGVDESMLQDVETRLEDCQRELKRHIDTETFVVGHSLENDFKACKLVPNCRILDSAHLFPHPSGLPMKNSLRFLASRYLKRRIQQGAHDSVIDARVSADIVYLKLLHGPSFGIRPRVSVLGLMCGAAAVEVRLFGDACELRELIGANDPSTPQNGARMDVVPVRHNRDAVRKAERWLQQRRTVAAGEDASFAFTWVQLSGTETPDTAASATTRVEAVTVPLGRVDHTNRHVMQIVRAAPHNSLVIILAGTNDGERGVCFAFVKDEHALGPSADWLDAADGTMPLSSKGDTAHRVLAANVEVPPACRQQ